MKELPISMKASLFSALAELAQAYPYFSFPMVRKTLGGSPLGTKPVLLREYLSEAMEKKVIHDSGRGWYSSVAEPATLSLEPVRKIIDLLSKHFPLLDFTCWSTIHWNPWLRHQVDRSTVFLSCDSVSLPTIHDFLRQQGMDSRANPNAVEISKNPLGAESIVLRPRLASAPGEGPGASVEQVLVDTWAENKSFHLFDPKELQEASCAWITQKRVQFGPLSRYLRARGGEVEDVFGDRPIIAK
jgi:hypothetical protein